MNIRHEQITESFAFWKITMDSIKQFRWCKFLTRVWAEYCIQSFAITLASELYVTLEGSGASVNTTQVVAEILDKPYILGLLGAPLI